MHNHFSKFLNIKEIILKNDLHDILECGADKGECTVMLADLKKFYPMNISVISDNPVNVEGVNFIQGISYLEIPKLPNESIDMALIDTDHNYWTLMKELVVVDPKLKRNGFIILHDVETFYYDTGFAETYKSDHPYPGDEIEKTAREFGGMTMALIDWLQTHRMSYKLVKYVPDSNGACAIQKTNRDYVNFMRASR